MSFCQTPGVRNFRMFTVLYKDRVCSCSFWSWPNFLYRKAQRSHKSCLPCKIWWTSTKFYNLNFLLHFPLTLCRKNLSGIPSECQTVWIQIRPDVLSCLIRVQTVCKGYQQTTKVATSWEQVRFYHVHFTTCKCVYKLMDKCQTEKTQIRYPVLQHLILICTAQVNLSQYLQ